MKFQFKLQNKIIAVDFDGTLCKNNYPEIGKPNTKIIKQIKQWQKSGNIIILNTCRCGQYLTDAVSWCEKHGLKFDAVNKNAKERIAKYGGDPRKISADIYVDDNTINSHCLNKILSKRQGRRGVEK